MPQSKLTRPDGRIVSVRYTMPYDTAKLHTPTTLHSHVEGGVPPSLARNRAARTLIAIPATTKRAAADVYGGMSSSPSRITSHVLPHTRHMTAMQTFVTTEEGRPWTAWMTWEWGSFSAVIASVSLVRFLASRRARLPPGRGGRSRRGPSGRRPARSPGAGARASR